MSIPSERIVVTEISETTGFANSSISAPINPVIHSAVNQGFPVVLLPEDFPIPVQENSPSVPLQPEL
jgi:hypothetical protein